MSLFVSLFVSLFCASLLVPLFLCLLSLTLFLLYYAHVSNPRKSQKMESTKIDPKSMDSNFNYQDGISWSKNGFIAYSLPGHSSKENLFLSYLENVDGRNWQLSTPQKLTVKPNIEGSTSPELSIVEWSNSNTDLAVVDVFGNFYILLAGVGLVHEGHRITPPVDGIASPTYELTAYNHLEMIFRDIINNQLNQKPSLSAQFVALSWLPLEKPQIVNKDAKLVTTPDSNASKSFAYGYGINQYHPANLCHPISTKQACITLRRNGELVLYYQSEHKVEYHKVSVKLTDGFKYTLDVTKAKFGFPNEKKIFLVTHDSLSGKIRTYAITIDWGFLVEAANKQKADPHYNTPKAMQKPPSVSVRVVNEMVPNIENEFEAVHYDDDLDNVLDGDAMEVDNKEPVEEMGGEKKIYKPKQKIGKLNHIVMLSPLYDEKAQVELMFVYDYTDENLKVTSSIHHYRFQSSESMISSAFTEIGNKKGVSSSSPVESEYQLVFNSQIALSQRAVAFKTSPCCFIAICDDGHMDVIPIGDQREYTENGTQAKIPTLLNSVLDTGFAVPKLDVIGGSSPFLVVFSPNCVCAAYCELNGKDTDLKLEFANKQTDTGITAEELYVTSVAFAFHHAYSCYSNVCCDDLLILMQQEIKRVSRKIEQYVPEPSKQVEAVDSFIESVICESHKAINFQLDIFSKESIDKLISNLPLQKLLSLQLILCGLDQRSSHVPQTIAWIILNLRSACFGIMFSLSSIYRQISKKKPTEDTYEDSVSRAETIISLTGNVRWIIELIILLCQEILQIFMTRNHPEQSKLFFENSIVLPLLLSKVPRLLLMHALSSIGKTHEVLKRLNKDLSEANKLFTPMKDALNRYFTACTNSPLNLNLYETFMRETDTYVKNEMTTLASNNPKGYTLKIEQKLICQGRLTDDLMNVAKWIVGKHASFISRDLKVGEMFYYDVDWLSIGHQLHTNRFDVTNVKVEHVKLENGQVFNESITHNKQMIPRQVFNATERVDVLRKVLFDVKDKSNIRKCVRCRSMSLINDPLVFSSNALSLWTVVFQRTCICGSAWVNLE